MDHVTVSSKFQVVIPKDAREALYIRKGQKLSVIVRGRHLAFVPHRSIEELRGFAKGINTDDYRDEEDRF